ncbi:hypothetical protein D1007_52202 [Hordeum vulgare]|nr:hypothetical protein D1007_52202 [Hordeum vulgare]
MGLEALDRDSELPPPQPESYPLNDDPGFNDDQDTSIKFEDDVFYEVSPDRSKVSLLDDHPGILPSSAASNKKASS